MLQKKSFMVAALILSFMVGLTILALLKNPPIEQKPHEHENEQGEEPKRLEDTLGQIDPASAKNLILKVEGMDSQEPADVIHTSLLQYKDSIGRVAADLEKRIFTIEYDSTKMTEEDLLGVVRATGVAVEVVTSEQ